MANFRPRELWVSTEAPSRELTPIVQQAQRAGMNIIIRKEGEEFDYGGAHIRVLAPRRDQATGQCVRMTIRS